MYKNLGIGIFIVALLSPAIATAQDDWQTHTDSHLTFRYPQDWVIIPPDEPTTTVTIASQEGVPDVANEPTPPGQIRIAISAFGGLFDDPSTDGSDVPYPGDAPIEVQFGYIVGLMSGVYVVLSGLFAEEKPVVTPGVYEEITINDAKAYTFSFEVLELHSYLILLVPNQASLIVIAAPGELDSWRETIYMIAESVESIDVTGSKIGPEDFFAINQTGLPVQFQ